MNPTNVLALISDLYGLIAALREENAELRKQVSNGEPELTDAERLDRMSVS